MKTLAVVGMMALGAVLAAVFYKTGVNRVPDAQDSPTLETSRARGDLSSSALGMARREELQGSPAINPDASDNVDVVTPVANNQPYLQRSLETLRSQLEEPLPGANLEAELLEKYRGFEPQDLLQVYPFIRDVHSKEMMATLHRAIDSGKYVSEVVHIGEPVDFDKYKEPGATILTVAHESEPLGNGLVEYRIVPIDRAHFPEMYARTYEEVWVHDRIDEAGICPFCTSSKVTITEHRQ